MTRATTWTTCSEVRMMEEGWKRRMVASEPRLSEMVEMYEDLGFEVKLEPVGPDDPYWEEDGCTICLEDPSAKDLVKVVYTRRVPGKVDQQDDGLFD